MIREKQIINTQDNNKDYRDNLARKILSDLTVFSKYSKYLPHLKRREIWDECISRVENMHIEKYPQLKDEIKKAFQYVREKKILPSMRSLQFAGKPIFLNNTRMYNCAFIAVKDWKAFSEIAFLLLSGCGVGFSVQRQYISQLPSIKKPKNPKKFLIGDSIEGWSDAVRALIKAYLLGSSLPLFDYSDIRPKGTLLKTSGGIAPGPEPLERCLNKIKSVLDKKTVGEYLTSVEVYDIICHLADAVLSGGIRRAALICLFDEDDLDMLYSKSNFKVDLINGIKKNTLNNTYELEVFYKNKAHYVILDENQFQNFLATKTLPWYYFESQRARSNNSIVLHRASLQRQKFFKIWEAIKNSGCGEPGFFLTNDYTLGTNPCGEISLNSKQFCNLVEINFSIIKTQEELEEAVKYATFIGTLQAGYTDFHYLDYQWKVQTEKEALLGVSFTGIADNSDYKKFDFERASQVALETNQYYAKLLGINSAARIGTCKPAGTTSLVLGTSSGIHSRYAKYYIRRIRFNKNEAIAEYLLKKIPKLCEKEIGNDDIIIVNIPQKSPETSILRNQESAIDLLERMKFFRQNWIEKTHRSGLNYHNISCTVSVKEDEWDEVGEWVWQNRDCYNGITFLPYDSGTYLQAPFEEITEEKYLELIDYLEEIDLTEVFEDKDSTKFQQEVACSGKDNCEII